MALIDRTLNQESPDLGMRGSANQKLVAGPPQHLSHGVGVFLGHDDAHRSPRSRAARRGRKDTRRAPRCCDDEVERGRDFAQYLAASQPRVFESEILEDRGDVVEFSVVEEQYSRACGHCDFLPLMVRPSRRPRRKASTLSGPSTAQAGV